MRLIDDKDLVVFHAYYSFCFYLLRVLRLSQTQFFAKFDQEYSIKCIKYDNIRSALSIFF
jgi:hypothetical protein